MKVLYFDVDGTLLQEEFGEPKPALIGGQFERLVRAAGFERICCVGNIVNVVNAITEFGKQPDAPGMIFEMCRGVFEDEAWFREHLDLIKDPLQRGAHLDLAQDWWYVDDLASWYLGQEGREDLFAEHEGGRIFMPSPSGNGTGVAGWLRSIAPA